MSTQSTAAGPCRHQRCVATALSGREASGWGSGTTFLRCLGCGVVVPVPMGRAGRFVGGAAA